ncbi:MAG: hypothetical protein ACTSUE_14770 [Promethearchaeota archaeon]
MDGIDAASAIQEEAIIITNDTHFNLIKEKDRLDAEKSSLGYRTRLSFIFLPVDQKKLMICSIQLRKAGLMHM